MVEKFEQKPESKEQPTSRIVLEIFRHGKKESKKGTPNELLMLTPEGKQQAIKKGKKISPQPDVAVAIGSPRRRTQETAGRIILAEKDKITPEMSLEEIEKVISSEQRYGKKIISDPRLDFYIKGPVGDKIVENFKAGRLLQYVIYESDKDALKLKDKESTTYSGAAGNVAELIKRYTEIAPNFHKIVNKNPEKYAQYKNQMERYLGSHQVVPESFLAKALEKIKGVEYKDKFVESVEGGFEETKGFRIEINNTSQGVKIEIKYKIEDQEEILEVSEEVLDEIIKDRDELNKKIGGK